MKIGACQIDIFINESFSLKDKRRVVNSLKERLRNRFNISVIEVSTNAQWKKSSLGISCVGNDEQSVQSLLQQVVQFVEGDDRLEITDLTIEIY